MAVSDMEKVSYYPHSIVSDAGATGFGTSIGEISGDLLSDRIDNETLKEILPYITGTAGGVLGHQAIRSFGPEKGGLPRQGDISAAAQILGHLGARGLGIGTTGKILAGGGGGMLGFLAENAKFK